MWCIEQIINFKQLNGVYYESLPAEALGKEEDYLMVRRAEGRFFSDTVVRGLPAGVSGPHAPEWRKRARSAARILDYFRKKTGGCVIDLGCGNGWFTNRVASLDGFEALGLDKNRQELEQAARVFEKQTLRFMHGDIFTVPLRNSSIDYFTIGAAVQYFEHFDVLLDRLLFLLKEGGEVHIFDSPFYHEKDLDAARIRSQQYYTQLGYPGMSEHYYHHSYQALKSYCHDFLYVPRSKSVFHKLIAAKDMPFPWVRITKEKLNDEE